MNRQHCNPFQELPFTKDGIVPDLILNPHAIPSRMTIGHLLETLEAKRATFKGERSDGTAFTGRLSVEEIGKQLAEFGYQKHGMEVKKMMMNDVFDCGIFK